MIPSRTWRRPPGRRGSGGLFIQPAGKAPRAPAMLFGGPAAPQPHGLATPGCSVPNTATPPPCPGWPSCRAAERPEVPRCPRQQPCFCTQTAATLRHHHARNGFSMPRQHLQPWCRMWKLVLKRTRTRHVPSSGGSQRPPFPMGREPQQGGGLGAGMAAGLGAAMATGWGPRAGGSDGCGAVITRGWGQ